MNQQVIVCVKKSCGALLINKCVLFNREHQEVCRLLSNRSTTRSTQKLEYFLDVVDLRDGQQSMQASRQTRMSVTTFKPT